MKTFSLPFLTLILALIVDRSHAQMLSAEEAVRIAVEHNHGIRLARLDARVAEVLNSPGQAGSLPDVDVVGSYNINNSGTRQTFFSGEVREVDNADARLLDAGVQLNWTIFDGFAMFAAGDRLETLEAIGRTRLRQTVEATTYDVLSTYYRLVQLRRAIEIQRESVALSRQRLAIAEAGRRIGTASDLVLVQARLDLNADSSAAMDLLVQEATSLARLNVLLGRDPSLPVDVPTEVPPAETLLLDTVRAEALRANSTLTQARQEKIAADHNVRELRGALMPQLDLFANYSFTRSTSAVGFLQSNRSLGPDYGARISIPLFHGGVERQALEVARISSEQAGLSEQLAGLQVQEGVLNAWSAYTTSLQRVALEDQNRDDARRQADVALESYRLGAITAVELRDVQLGLIAAAGRLLLAQYEAKLAELQLKWLAGRLI